MSHPDRSPGLTTLTCEQPAKNIDRAGPWIGDSPAQDGDQSTATTLELRPANLLPVIDDRAALAEFILEPRQRPFGHRWTNTARRLALQSLPPVGRFARVKRMFHKSLDILAEEGAWRLGTRSARKLIRVAKHRLGLSPDAQKTRLTLQRETLVESIAARAENRRRGGKATRSRTEIAHLIEHRCQTCRHFGGSTCALMKKSAWRSAYKTFCRTAVDPSGQCPQGHWPNSETAPITRRNLLYFVYPMQHPDHVWEWNVAELLKRIHIFNGRRIITIATEESGKGKGGRPVDPPEAVIAAFAGHDVEFRMVPNDLRRGESAHFLAAMREIASTDPTEAVFYGHAKGVTRLDEVDAIRAWSAAMYHHNLDRIDEVCDLLGHWPCVGIAKVYGYPESFLWGKSDNSFSEAGRTWHGWHYSGTFWWARHQSLFSRPDWDQFELYNYATEKYLANFFRADEAICLAYDDCPQRYDLSTWFTGSHGFDPIAYALPNRNLKAA